MLMRADLINILPVRTAEQKEVNLFMVKLEAVSLNVLV